MSHRLEIEGTIYVGSTPTFEGRYLVDGTLTNADAVTFTFTDPVGVVTSYTAPTQITNPATGKYRRNQVINRPGRWQIRMLFTKNSETQSFNDWFTVEPLIYEG